MTRHGVNHTALSQYKTSNNQGKERWSYRTNNNVFSSVAIGPNSTLYVGSEDNIMYALNPNGTKKWTYTTGGSIVSNAAVDKDGTVYFTAQDNKLYALDANGGKKWTYPITATGTQTPSSPAIGSDGTVYVGSYDGRLYAINPDGSKIWDFPTGDRIFSSPAIAPNGTIYVCSYDHNVYAVSPAGAKQWSFPTGGMIFSSPAIGSDGTIYIGAYDSKFYAIWPNGTKRWDFTTSNTFYSSPAIGPDGTIYVGNDDSKLHAFTPSGKNKWNFTAGQAVECSPTVTADGTIYVGSNDGKMYAIWPDGSEKWEFPTGKTILSAAVIDSDGTVYFGSFDYYVHALGILAPSMPLNLKALGGNGKVDLTWSPPSYKGGQPIVNYSVLRATTPGAETFLAKMGNVTQYIDSTVTNGQKYYYMVVANNSLWDSPRSNEANATPIGVPDPPRNLVAIPGNAQVNLTWSAPTDNGGSPIIDYSLYRNGSYLKTVGNVLKYTDTGLVNGKNYTYNVTATNSFGEGWLSVGASATPRTIPGAPQNLKATAEKNQVHLSWMGPASDGGVPVLNYSIYRGTSTGAESLFVDGYTNGTTWTDTSVTGGSTYYYMVSATNVAGKGPKSIEASATPYSVPNAPALNATAGKVKVTLSWNVPNSHGAAVLSYKIYRGMTPNSEILQMDAYTGGTIWADTNVKAAKGYYYQVSAVNLAGEGPKSNEVYALPYSIPDAPTLTATGGNMKVMLTWTVPNSNGAAVGNYSIYRGTAPTGEALLVRGYSGGITWTDTNITLATTYYYMVSANNAAGEGARSAEQSAMPYGVPDAPRLTGAVGNLKVVLNWTVPNSNGAAVISYNIYRGTTSGLGTVLVTGYTGGIIWTDTGVTAGTRYYYTVTAVNIAGEGRKSNEGDALAGRQPGTPTGLKASAGDRKVSLKWMADTTGGTPDIYYVYRGDSQLGPFVLVTSTTWTNYTDTGLKNGHEYWYMVKAKNIYGSSANTTAISSTPHVANNMLSTLMIWLLIVIIAVVIAVVAVIILRKKKAKTQQ
jgi:outer membrane protein assembly factor BamB/fibronectin type 3 domain-containing protein